MQAQALSEPVDRHRHLACFPCSCWWCCLWLWGRLGSSWRDDGGRPKQKAARGAGGGSSSGCLPVSRQQIVGPGDGVESEEEQEDREQSMSAPTDGGGHAGGRWGGPVLVGGERG